MAIRKSLTDPEAEAPDPYDIPELAQVGEAKRLQGLVETARQAWEARADARSRRRRARDYFRGKQWETTVDPDSGEIVDEAEAIRRQNRIPWVMNEIRPIVQNLKGQFRQGYSDTIAVSRNRKDSQADEQMTVALEQVHDINLVSEVDAQVFQEDLISGLIAWKVRARWFEQYDRDDVAIDQVDPNRVFYNPDASDIRGFDIRFIGEIHDWTLDEVIHAFASDEAGERRIRGIYAELRPDWLDEFVYTRGGFEAADRIGWYYPDDPNKARVIELWRKEYRWNRYVKDPLDESYQLTELTDDEIDQLNEERTLESQMLGVPDVPLLTADRVYEGVWRVYFLSPDGWVLYEGDTPYWHDEHPYVLGWGTLLDGDHWGIIDDIIDPQRLMNRMTAAIDFSLGIAAKGVLLIPEDSIPEGMTIDDFASEWTRFGGAIKFKAKPGIPIPQQITANAIPAGAFEWLGQQRGWMEKISGVNGPVQGSDPASKDMPASLYGMQIQQGQVGNLDHFKAFYAYKRIRDLKVLKLIAQFYDRRLISAPGRKEPLLFDPERVQDLEMDIVTQDVQDTATTRQLWETDLKEHLQNGRLTFRQYLELSSHPKAEAIIKTIEATNPLLLGEPLAPELALAAQAGDPDALATMQQAQEAGM